MKLQAKFKIEGLYPEHMDVLGEVTCSRAKAGLGGLSGGLVGWREGHEESTSGCGGPRSEREGATWMCLSKLGCISSICRGWE